MEERIQKLIAAAGLCSRRTAETYLRQGRVTVNGRTAALGDKADSMADEILVDGKPLPGRETFRYLMLNKPRGYACSLSDPHAEHLVTELLSGCGERVYPVGRLDVDSEGLLLLTNDGALAHRLLHPSFGAEKVYLVTVTGFRPGCVERIEAIRDLDGEPIAPVKVELREESGGETLLSFTLHQGRKRQIRRMCRKVGLSVRRLQRIMEHGVSLGDLPEGCWRELTAGEICLLRGQERENTTGGEPVG